MSGYGTGGGGVARSRAGGGGEEGRSTCAASLLPRFRGHLRPAGVGPALTLAWLGPSPPTGGLARAGRGGVPDFARALSGGLTMKRCNWCGGLDQQTDSGVRPA